MVATSYGVGLYRASEAHTLFRPRIYPLERAGIIHCHGWAASDPVPLAVTAAYLTTYRDEPSALARRGFVSIAADLGGGETFGNATGDAGMDDALTYLRANGASDDPVGLLGGSMGGQTACVWARQHLASVECIALLVPGLDVEDIRVNDRLGAQAAIEAAHTDNATWQAARPTRNPIEFADELADIPIRIWYSTDDDVCLPEFVTAFAAAHGNTTLTSLGAVGHNGLVADGDEIAEWMDTHLA